MDRIQLTHLTFTGIGMSDASIDFSPHVTVIHGPSDTGKSFILDAIDFVLGAKKLKEIPERDGYNRVLLGLQLPSGDRVTLTRAVNGGGVGLYRSDFRTEPPGLPDLTLAAKHSSTSNSNISRFLLNQVGLDGKSVRKNAQNKTHMLSFRDLTRLCLVGETEMQAEEAPGLSGNPVNRTKEVSVLKLLLTGEDDSDLIAVPSSQEQKRLRGAREEVVERMLAQLETKLDGVADPGELRLQLGKLNDAIDVHTATVGDLTRQRGQLLAERRRIERNERAQRVEYLDATALQQRFGLLLKQYTSDLSRLDMIAEAGNLLGYFRPGTCVFCGAEPSSQHLNLNCEGDSTSFGLAIEVETQKTRVLREDLLGTIERLDARIEALGRSIRSARLESERLQIELDELDVEMNPQQGGLRELLTKRSEVERYLGLSDQVESLEAMLRKLSKENGTEVAIAVAGLSLTAVREFSSEISTRLEEWGYPDAGSVRYDRNELDIVAGDQLRSAHGKGVRAVLHAAFTLSLAQYCFDREIGRAHV